MKIAFIINNFPVLSETFVLHQITGLIDRGHEVDIYAKRQSVPSLTQQEVNKYRLMETSNFIDIPTNKPKRILKALGLFIIYLFQKPKVILRSLNIFRYKKEASSLYLFYYAITFLRTRQKYDVIYCHFGPNGNMGVFLREIGAVNGKVVTVFHGYDITTYLDEYGPNIYNRLFKNGDMFLPISDLWKERLYKIGCSREKIIVHRMGVDSNKLKKTSQKTFSHEDVQIISIGRLVEKKGIEYGIRSVTNLLPQYPKLQYIIVGDGPLIEELKQLVKHLNADKNIVLMGAKNQDEIRKLLEQSDIMLAPSVTSKTGDQEGIPVVIMEGMAMELPVVSTWHTGIPELVLDEITGLLAPERDINSISVQIARLVNDPNLRKQMGRAGRRVIEEHYSLDKLNDRLVNVLNSI
ncbi:glycosyltransferase [Paenibacillus solisilvae]|uniref:Glycosyltransferase n=1 Tax=Paenibacillus solisilvae TaxID=2486751 RepID=A0ABW0VYE1_9BACL